MRHLSARIGGCLTCLAAAEFLRECLATKWGGGLGLWHWVGALQVVAGYGLVMGFVLAALRSALADPSQLGDSDDTVGTFGGGLERWFRMPLAAGMVLFTGLTFIRGTGLGFAFVGSGTPQSCPESGFVLTAEVEFVVFLCLAYYLFTVCLDLPRAYRGVGSIINWRPSLGELGWVLGDVLVGAFVVAVVCVGARHSPVPILHWTNPLAVFFGIFALSWVPMMIALLAAVLAFQVVGWWAVRVGCCVSGPLRERWKEYAWLRISAARTAVALILPLALAGFFLGRDPCLRRCHATEWSHENSIHFAIGGDTWFVCILLVGLVGALCFLAGSFSSLPRRWRLRFFTTKPD